VLVGVHPQRGGDASTPGSNGGDRARCLGLDAGVLAAVRARATP